MRLFSFILSFFICFYLFACETSTGSKEEEGRAVINEPPPELQQFPRWRPNGNTILFFNYGVTLYDSTTSSYNTNPDSIGIWAINADGSNKRKLFTASYAVWGPDGEWIYYQGGQIGRVRFNGQTIDTTSFEQLTFEGGNIFPDASFENKFLAYDKNVICDDPETMQCGLVILDLETDETILVARYGSYPAWQPIRNDLLYIDHWIKEGGAQRGDSIWVYSVETSQKSFLANMNGEHRYPTYSPLGNKVAFSSSGEGITILDANDGEILNTISGRGMPDWSPNGEKLVYIGPKSTIWISNTDGSNPRQITTRPEGPIDQ